MQSWKSIFVLIVLAFGMTMNGCILFPNNDGPNRPAPVRYKTTQKRKITPTPRIRPTRLGNVQTTPNITIIPTRLGRSIGKKINKLSPIPSPGRILKEINDGKR